MMYGSPMGQSHCLQDAPMELEITPAIRAQFALLEDDERSAMIADLRQLADHPERLGSIATRHDAPDTDLWTVRLSPQMRALVRTKGDLLQVLAVVSREQLLPYLEPDGQRAA